MEGRCRLLEAGQIPNVEQNELFHPVLYLYRRERIDSGGAGRFRGGLGAALAVIARDTDAPIDWQPFSYRQAFAKSVGACGGWPTRCTEAAIVRASDVREPRGRGEIPASIDELAGALEDFAPKGAYRQAHSDVFHCYRQGGTGYGDPLEREPELVAADLRDGYISAISAREIYGVVVDDAGAPDAAAREARRREIRSAARQGPRRGARSPAIAWTSTWSSRPTARCAARPAGMGSERSRRDTGWERWSRCGGCLLRRDPDELIDHEVIMRHYFSP